MMDSGSNYPALERAAQRGETACLLAYARAALDAVVQGRSQLRAVAHPLGFVCLPVLREGGDGVCVHVHGGSPGGSHGGRSEDGELTTSAIHAHSWDLISCVLFGAIGNVPVRVVDDARLPTHRVFAVTSTPDGVDDLRPTARLVRFSAEPVREHRPEEIFTMAAGEFHSTVDASGEPDGASATVVLGRTVQDAVDLALGPLHGLPHRVERRRLAPARSADIARGVLRRMDESAARPTARPAPRPRPRPVRAERGPRSGGGSGGSGTGADPGTPPGLCG
nr:hypothetical protein [Streptacidiphilus fuscans]